jgi:hypothetical protein
MFWYKKKASCMEDPCPYFQGQGHSIGLQFSWWDGSVNEDKLFKINDEYYTFVYCSWENLL